MSVKKSDFLLEMIDRSKAFGDGHAHPVTAVRFVLAVIEKITNTPEENKDNDCRATESLLRSIFPDMDKAREKLEGQLATEKNTVIIDDIYMRRRMAEAERAAEEKGAEELTAEDILRRINDDPSSDIKLAVDDGEEQIDKEIKSLEDQIKKLRSETDKKARDNRTAVPDTDDGSDDADGKKSGDKLTNKAKKDPLSARMGLSELINDVKRIRTTLSSTVFGQEHAINEFATGYFQACMHSISDKKRKRPKATFLFAGPPGVGKTFLAETVAEALKLPFVRFDMSEYSEYGAVMEFCGVDKSYKNPKAGNVTGFVHDNPRCVLLFDEIEKANFSVIQLFLQILDAGRLKDSYHAAEVSFSDAILIFTTNAGKQLYEDPTVEDLSTVSRRVVLNALATDINPQKGTPFFPAAICSRFASGNVVMFNHIKADNLRKITKREIEKRASAISEEMGMQIDVDDNVYTTLLFSEGGDADARSTTARAGTFFNDELYELFRLLSSEKSTTAIENIEKVTLKVELEGASEDIVKLYSENDPPKMLLFAEGQTLELCRSKLNNVDLVSASDLDGAISALKQSDIDFVVIDLMCGAAEDFSDALNVEDSESKGREFLRFLREQRKDMRIFLLEGCGLTLGEEERISFVKQGVKGTVKVLPEEDDFAGAIAEIAAVIHQQESIIKLAKQNKIISFETSQSVCDDGRTAEISIFDLKLVTAVDSEDNKDIVSSVSKPNISFDDVIGAGDAKKELQYFVEYLKNPKKYLGTGVKAPKGVLLYGPPGTGKTLLAKAMASESDVTFIAAEGNQFLKRYVGEGPEEVHKIFATARKYAPAILFIDEIDAIGKNRLSDSASAEASADILTAFLTEMDGFDTDASRPVFVLAATNFDVDPKSARALDPALLRRFDRRVYIDLPSKEDRIKFLNMKIRKNPALDISEDQVENIAMRSTGMSLAELDSAVELALRSAIREGSTKVTDAILEEAFETFNYGEKKTWDSSLLLRTARHEAGHALLCWLGGETPSYLTIVARGDHGGYMQHADNEGKALYLKDELLSRIRVSLGGRAAELVYYGEKDGISTGASGDLANATNLARSILCSYGMDDEFGPAVISKQDESGTLSAEVRGGINRILRTQMAEATRVISENKSRIDALVSVLMEKNHLIGTEIDEILKNN